MILNKHYKRVDKKRLYFGEEKLNSDNFTSQNYSFHWYKAHAICRTKDGNLASIESQSVWNAINEFLKTKVRKKRQWWTSATNLDSKKDFIWANTGTPMDYNVWSKGEPNNKKSNERCRGAFTQGLVLTTSSLSTAPHTLLAQLSFAVAVVANIAPIAVQHHYYHHQISLNNKFYCQGICQFEEI
uniref:C-type lectin domain-containing protein n=1 Tax=Glossina brevipalpis TaxID=37001 RepID=A0A1A9WN46_9MUSC